jgi:hypothetical protein
MALKPLVTDINTVAENLRSLYEQRAGQWVLALEGTPPGFVTEADHNALKNTHGEFRDTNRTLNAKVTDLENKLKGYEGVDLAEVAALKAKADELAKKGVKSGDDIQKQIEAGIQAALGPVTKELQAFKDEAAQAKQTIARQALETALTTAGLKAGVDEKALPDYVARGLRTWTVEEGRHVAKNSDGTVVRKSGEPVTMEQWAADLAAEPPHLYKPSKAGGAPPSPGGSGGNGSVREIAADARLSEQDLKDIASGAAIRASAAA